jgi:hypothetical protein
MSSITNNNCNQISEASRSGNELARPFPAQSSDVKPGSGTLLASNRNARVRCPVCERVVARRSRQQRYCSPKCMRAANYARKAGSGQLLGQDTALIRDPHKSLSKNNSVQTAKTGSSLFFNGPLNLLGGGSWNWPARGYLDRNTLAKIRHSEIGGEVLPAPETRWCEESERELIERLAGERRNEQ